MTHTTTQNEPAYPLHDKADRQGIYCEHCGTIFYIFEPLVIAVRQKQCPVCGYIEDGITTLRWITKDIEFQPEGDGF